MEQDNLFDVVTVEDLKSIYVDGNTLIEPPYKLKRLNSAAGRFYFTVTEDNKLDRVFVGATSIGKMLPMERSLLQWYCRMGYNEAIEYVRQRSLYGSFLHTILGEYSINKTFSFKKFDDRILWYMQMNHIPTALFERGNDGKKGWQEELRMDIAAYDKWVSDYNIKPIGIEVALKSDTEQVATMVDFIGFCNDKNYTEKTPEENRKQHLMITDFKSGKSGFYKSHRFQLEACKNIWQENYPHLPTIEAVYNFAPKDFKTTEPSYNFTNQTNKFKIDDYNALLMLAVNGLASKIERKVRIIDGTMEFGKKNTLVQEISIQRLLEDGLWQEYLIKQPELV